MANKTINQLTSLGTVADSDEFVLYDVSADETKKATKSTLLSGMQTELTFDDTPTEDSTNPVTSSGVYDALSGKANIKTAYSSNITDALASVGITDTYLVYAFNTLVSDIANYNNGVISISTGGPVYGFLLWKYNDDYYSAILLTYNPNAPISLELRYINGDNYVMCVN